MKVGVLALQGCVDPHLRLFAAAGIAAVPVRSREALLTVDRLVMPGGESTTMLKLATRLGLWEPLQAFARVKPVWGICAGAILLAREVAHPKQPSLQAIDILAERNFYGSQLDSFECTLDVFPLGAAMAVQFIRAPRLTPQSSSVEVLARCDGQPVCMKQGHVLVSAFHVELGQDPRLHSYFAAFPATTPALAA